MTKHYEIEAWTKHEPRESKDWADILEAWVGAVLEDHETWNESAPLSELKLFMRDIWRVRYRKLEQYGMQLRTKSVMKTERYQKVKGSLSTKIVFPADELIKNVLFPRNTLRSTRLGWLYKIVNENGGVEMTAFSQESDQDARKRLIAMKATREEYSESRRLPIYFTNCQKSPFWIQHRISKHLPLLIKSVPNGLTR